MKGFVQDIAQLAAANEDFRRVLYTAHASQIVLMTLPVGGEIGAETHTLDQFFRIEGGEGQAVIDGVVAPIQQGYAVLVPAGTQHNIINTGTTPLRLLTIYAPPNHRDGVLHHTRAEAEADHEQFDGVTTRQT